MDGYKRVEDAAAAGLAAIAKMKDSDKSEFIGLIYQDKKTGKYLFTEPQGQNSDENSRGVFNIPKGSARAIFHNHPFDPKADRKATTSKRHLFSPEDIEMSARSGLPSYIGIDDEIKLWDPKRKNKKSFRGGIGESVLAEIAMDLLPQKRTSSNTVAKR